MDTQEFVCNIPYFDGLSEDEHQSIKKLATERRYERGDILIYEGDKATALYVVCSGAVKIFKTSIEGKEQILSIIRPGETFNDVGVFDEGLNPASAQAMGEVVLYELGKNELDVIMQNHPIVAHNTVKVLEEDGMIKLNRHKVTITNIEALRGIVEEPV